MKQAKLPLSFYLSALLIFFPSIHAQNTITINDTNLPGGGQAFEITGSPETQYRNAYGTVFAGKTDIIVLDKGSRIVRHSGVVDFEMDALGLSLKGDTMLELSPGLFEFTGSITVDNLATTKATGTTFECRDGIVYMNGESTGQSQVTYQNAIIISCTPGGNIRVEPKVF